MGGSFPPPACPTPEAKSERLKSKRGQGPEIEPSPPHRKKLPSDRNRGHCESPKATWQSPGTSFPLSLERVSNTPWRG